MNAVFRQVELEMDHETYMKFLIGHHDGLNLPYAFPHKLGFLSSPLLYGKALLILDEESYEPVGAAGFVYGTGADEFQDRGLCQIEVAFLRQEYRGKPLFAGALLALLELMQRGAGEVEVRAAQFWLKPEQARTRLFAKLLALPGAEATPVDGMLRCVVPYGELVAHARRYEARP